MGLSRGSFPQCHWEIEGGGIDQKSGNLNPGDSTTLTVNLEAGGYQLYCPVGNHKERGMDGTLSVK